MHDSPDMGPPLPPEFETSDPLFEDPLTWAIAAAVAWLIFG